MFQPSLHGDVVSKSCRRGPGRSSFSHTLGRFVSPIPHNSALSDPGYYHRQETASGVEGRDVVGMHRVFGGVAKHGVLLTIQTSDVLTVTPDIKDASAVFGSAVLEVSLQVCSPTVPRSTSGSA